MRAFVCPCARACPTPLGPSSLSALDNIRPSLRRPALGGARREFITGKTTTPALLAECQQRARPAVRVRPPAPSLACQPPSRQPAGARAPARSPDSAWRNSPLAGRQASERLITSRLATSRQRRQKATSERKRQPSLALSGSLVFQPASQPASAARVQVAQDSCKGGLALAAKVCPSAWRPHALSRPGDTSSRRQPALSETGIRLLSSPDGPTRLHYRQSCTDPRWRSLLRHWRHLASRDATSSSSRFLPGSLGGATNFASDWFIRAPASACSLDPN